MDQISRSQGLGKLARSSNHAFHNPMPKGRSSKNQSNIQNLPPPLLSQADRDTHWPTLPTKQQQSESSHARKAGGGRIGSEPGGRSNDQSARTGRVSTHTKSSSGLNPNAEPYIPPSTSGANTGVPNQAPGFDGLSSIPPASLNSTGERASNQNPHRPYSALLATFSPSGNMELLDWKQEQELKRASLLRQRQLSLDTSPRSRVETPPTDLADLSHTRSRPPTPGLDENYEANDDPAEDSDSEFGPNQNGAPSNHGREHMSNALDNAIHNGFGFESPNKNAEQNWQQVLYTDRHKFYIQFYDNLVLYAGLQTFHDEGSPPPYRFDKSNLNTLGKTELRQIFLDCIAYLCDVEKDPRTTAAAALQKVDDNKTVLWITANEGFPCTDTRNIPKFIETIIHAFRDVSTEDRMDVRAKFFRKAIDLATLRMDTYRTTALVSLKKVLKSPKIQASSAASKGWKPELQKLKVLMEDDKQRPELAEWCYLNRRSWSDFIKQKELAQDKNIYWFERLKHYLYRLSAHAFAVDIIAIAAREVRSVRNISEVKTFELWGNDFKYDNKGKEFEISTDGPMNILERLLESFPTDPQTSSYCREALKEEILSREKMRDDPSHNHSASPPPTLDEWMRDRRKFRRYYHAELQIVRYFEKKGFEYADERFIGCSKRACYVCYHFLKWYGEIFPDQKFVLPGKHSKILHMVKVPWIESKDNEPLFMMDKLNVQLARHIEEALLNKGKLEERRKIRHLSTHASTTARQHLPSDRRKLTSSPHLVQFGMVNNTGFRILV
jgi:hypothetical protein